MSAKGIALQGRTSRRPIPIEIETLAAGWRGQPHALEARIPAPIGDKDRTAARDILDVGNEAPCAHDAAAVQIFYGQRRGDLVVPGRDIERFVLVDAGSAVWRVRRAEAVIERGLQGGRIVSRAIASSAEAAVLHADRLEIGKQQHWRHHD